MSEFLSGIVERSLEPVCVCVCVFYSEGLYDYA